VGETTVLDGFTITGGMADELVSPHSAGGGLLNVGGSPLISNCLFVGNHGKFAGGLYNIGVGSLSVLNCSFINNSAQWEGGGASSFSSGEPVFMNCAFLGNVGAQGAGVNMRSAALMVNCLFSGNEGSAEGGGIFIMASSPRLINCTFSGNTSGIGGGMYNIHSGSVGSQAFLSNCIFWGNTASFFGDELAASGSSEPTIAYSTVRGSGGSGDGWDDTIGEDGGGNIDGDPLFVDPDGQDDIYGTEDDDLTLSRVSPCVESGNNIALPADAYDMDGDGDLDEPIPFDLKGNPRVTDGDTDGSAIVDMGAFEHDGSQNTAIIVRGWSCVSHDAAGEFCLEIFPGNNIEPRVRGVEKLVLEMSSPVVNVAADVSCAVNEYTGFVTAEADGTTVTVTFSQPLPDVDCCTVGLTGDSDDSFVIRTLSGDINRDGQVIIGDASSIKVRYQQPVGEGNFIYDYNCDNQITTGDFYAIKTKFQHMIQCGQKRRKPLGR
jgi:hypothetical protein